MISECQVGSLRRSPGSQIPLPCISILPVYFRHVLCHQLFHSFGYSINCSNLSFHPLREHFLCRLLWGVHVITFLDVVLLTIPFTCHTFSSLLVQLHRCGPALYVSHTLSLLTLSILEIPSNRIKWNWHLEKRKWAMNDKWNIQRLNNKVEVFTETALWTTKHESNIDNLCKQNFLIDN